MWRFVSSLVLALTLVVAAEGCAHNGPPPVVTQAVDCTLAAVQAKVPSLLPGVLAILVSGGDDWAAQLTALEQLGVDALMCAVTAAHHALEAASSQPAALRRVATTTQVDADRARARAAAYLQRKGYTVTAATLAR